MPQGDYPDFPDLPGPSPRWRPPAVEKAPGAGCPRAPADPYNTQTQDCPASPVLPPPDYPNDVVMDDSPEPPQVDDPEETDLGGPLDQMDWDLPPTEGEAVRAINAMLLHRLVRMGDPDATIAAFATLGFPNCFGALDGTHIPICAPHHSGGRYMNRKGYHSVVLQALVDSRGHFQDIYVGWPGSTHDTRVFRNSGLCRRLEAGTYIPQREIPRGGHHHAALRHRRCGIPPPALAHAPVHGPSLR
ncbi:uncharacterized protein LOC142014711 [Carettochelys insculpta]|uniref:uncharacterized protein LOC142014711 n=1 Tax=Carettochelys insculpta TaxID=44489 RepID=UPI003EBDCC6C